MLLSLRHISILNEDSSNYNYFSTTIYEIVMKNSWAFKSNQLLNTEYQNIRLLIDFTKDFGKNFEQQVSQKGSKLAHSHNAT